MNEQRLHRLNNDKARFVQILLNALANANRVPEQTKIVVEVGDKRLYEGVPGQPPIIDKLDQNALTLLLNTLQQPAGDREISPNAYADVPDRGSVRITAQDLSPPQQGWTVPVSPRTSFQPQSNSATPRDRVNHWLNQRAMRQQPELQAVAVAEWLLQTFGHPTPQGKTYFAEYYKIGYDDAAQQYTIASDQGQTLMQFEHGRQGIKVNLSQMAASELQDFGLLFNQLSSGQQPSSQAVPGERHQKMGALSPRGDMPFQVPSSADRQPYVYSPVQVKHYLGDVCDFLLDRFSSRGNGVQKFQAEKYAVVYDEISQAYRIFDDRANQIVQFRKDHLAPWLGVQVVAGELTPAAVHDLSAVVHTLKAPSVEVRTDTPEQRVWSLGDFAPLGDRAQIQASLAQRIAASLQHLMQRLEVTEFQGNSYSVSTNNSDLTVVAKDPRGVVLQTQQGVVATQRLSASDISRLTAFSKVLEQDAAQSSSYPQATTPRSSSQAQLSL